MLYLIIASLIWAFSFGLIKENLVDLNPLFVAWARLIVAIPIFLPFLRTSLLNKRLAFRLMVLGAVQYGLLYSTYTIAFQYLDAYQVALFTILTPLYVTLIDNLYERRFSWVNLLMATLAVLGAVVIKYKGLAFGDLLKGFLLVQVANICFAFGQMEYRRLRVLYNGFKDREVYAMLFIGAVFVTTLTTTFYGGWSSFGDLTLTQVWILLYLGVLGTGIGFFLWNVGATKTDAGVLAVFNNLKIPLAVVVSLTIFGESTDILRLCIGGGIMVFAVWCAGKYGKAR